MIVRRILQETVIQCFTDGGWPTLPEATRWSIENYVFFSRAPFHPVAVRRGAHEKSGSSGRSALTGLVGADIFRNGEQNEEVTIKAATA